MYLHNEKMPQLVPYYFTNQSNVTFVLIISLVYIFSRFILPLPNSLLSCRAFLFSV